MNKWLKGWNISIFTVAGIVLLLIVITIFLFSNLRASLVPYEEEEGKAIIQAERYLQQIYPTMKYEISHVLYDSDNQYGNFEYAAVIKDTETEKTFKVYQNSNTNKIEDDITIQKEKNFRETIRPQVYSYVTDTFGEPKGIAFTPS